MNPNQVYYSSNSSGPSRGRRTLVIVGLIVIILGAIGYFLWSGRSSNNNTTSNKKTGSQSTGQVMPLRLAGNFSFVAPPNMSSYNQQTGFVASVGDYTTQDNACNLQYGVVSSADLPGTTPQNIASNHLGASADFGAVGGTPTTGNDLVLKAASGQHYSIPTYNFIYSRDGVNYLASYSITLLPGNSRAYVRTYCANTGDPVSEAAFKKINNKAKEITIKVE